MMKLIKNEQKEFESLLRHMMAGGSPLYVGSLLKRAIDLFPDRIALIYGEQQLSYKALYQKVCAALVLLKKKGVQPGDRVLLSIVNSIDFYVVYFAVWQSGAIVAPLNTFLIDRELEHIITDAQPRAIIVDTKKADQFKQWADSITLITTDECMNAPSCNNLFPPVIIREHTDVCALLYTSGTTGVPKGVMLSSKNIITNIAQILSRVPLDHSQQDRVFAVLPLFHVFAQNTCVWTSFFVGVTVVVVPKIDRREILKALKHKPTLLLGVPALYGLLCLMKNAPLSCVRLFVSGGDALPDKIKTAFALVYRRVICNGYGLTETSPVIAAHLDDERVVSSTIGTVLPGIAYEIRDEWGAEVEKGQIGQLWVRGDNVMLGYYNAPDATANVLKDEWFNTGDLVYEDDAGRLVIAGREKDLIIHKGFNVYPQEIENILMLHSNVIGVGVVGKADPDVGEHVIAFVQLKAKQDAIQAELKQLCMNHLAPYKIPKLFVCDVDELPMTATRKVDKKVLRAKCDNL